MDWEHGQGRFLQLSWYSSNYPFRVRLEFPYVLFPYILTDFQDTALHKEQSTCIRMERQDLSAMSTPVVLKLRRSLWAGEQGTGVKL